MLGAVASFIIYTNVAALMGRSITEEQLEKINAELESDIMIRAIHDVKGIDMGNTLVRYKAELDFDGRELSRVYLDKQDLSALLEVSSFDDCRFESQIFSLSVFHIVILPLELTKLVALPLFPISTGNQNFSNHR